jgi:hypothetical protein
MRFLGWALFALLLDSFCFYNVYRCRNIIARMAIFTIIGNGSEADLEEVSAEASTEVPAVMVAQLPAPRYSRIMRPFMGALLRAGMQTPVEAGMQTPAQASPQAPLEASPQVLAGDSEDALGNEQVLTFGTCTFDHTYNLQQDFQDEFEMGDDNSFFDL